MQGTTPSNGNKAINRKLERAAARVNASWFPANLPFVARVRKHIAEEKDYNLERLLEDLKRDFALFTFCLKVIVQQTNAHNIPPEARSNPLEILRWAGYDRLAALISNEHSGLQTYDKDAVSELQTQRTKETLTSASAAEVLSTQFSLDSEVGFSAGLLRQLGSTLIAWNFPKEYEQAIQLVSSGRMGLDDALTRDLGFSPRLLGQRIIRDWGLGSEIKAVIETTAVNRRKNLSFEEGFMLKLCDIGEVFARANSPELYPKAQEEWTNSKKEIQNTLGETGCEQIETQIHEKVKAYNPFSKEYRLIKKHGNNANHYGLSLMKRNRYLTRCPQVLKDSLKDLYAGIHSKSISEQGLSQLAKRIIPSVGFINGCIYLVKPDTLTLVPRFQIGDMPLEKFGVLDCMLESISDPVVSAYFARFPIMLTGKGKSKVWSTHLAGPIGTTQTAGVLYLECSAEMLEVPEVDPMLYYKALNQALADCLNV